MLAGLSMIQMQPTTPRATAFVVAASDAPAAWIARADLVCDGTNDEVEIQAAIDEVAVDGGVVLLSSGAFSIGAAVTLAPDIILQGQGWSWGGRGTRLQQAYDGNMLVYDPPPPQEVVSITVRDLFLRGTPASYATGAGIYLGENLKDVRLFTLGIYNMPSHGIYVAFGWGLVVFDVVSEYCGGSGLYMINGTEPNIMKCKLFGNDEWGLYSECGNARIIGNELGGAFGAARVTGEHSLVVGNHLLSTTGSADSSVLSLGTNCIATGNYIQGDAQDYGIKISGHGTYTKANTIKGFAVAPIYVPTFVERATGLQQVEQFQDCLAASANHIVNAEDLSAASPIACAIAGQPDVPRVVTWSLTHANITGFSLAISGMHANGIVKTTTVTEADGWAGTLDRAYARVMIVTFTRTAGTGVGDTLNIGIGDKLGLSNSIYQELEVYKVKENNADYTNYTVDADYNTVSIDGGIGGGDDYTVWYRASENIIQT